MTQCVSLEQGGYGPSEDISPNNLGLFFSGASNPPSSAYVHSVSLPAASNVSGPQRVSIFPAYGDPRPSAPFLSEGNARWLQGNLEAALSKAVGQKVKVPLDGRFIQEMQQIAVHSLGPAPNGVGLADMNRTFLERFFELQMVSISQGALFHKYFIAQDRPRTMPYGQYSHGNSVTVSPSGYQTAHPWSARQASFLKATTGLRANGHTSKQAMHTTGLFAPNPTHYCRGK